MSNLHEYYSYVLKYIGPDYVNIDKLPLYFGAFFQEKDVDNSAYTKYLLNLDIDDVAPFGEILSRLGYSTEKNTNTSDVTNGFIDLMGGLASLQLVKELTNELIKLEGVSLSELLKNIDAIKGLNNSKPAYWTDGLLEYYLSPNEVRCLDSVLTGDDVSSVSESEIFIYLKGLLDYIKIKQTESVYTEEVKQAVDNLLHRMEILYERLWDNSYIGIILPNGEVRYSKGEKHRGKEGLLSSLNVYIQSLAKAWYNEASISFDKVAPIGVTLNTEYDMVPDLHLGYLSSKDNWIKHHKPKLKGKLLKQLSSIPKESYSNFVTQLYKTLTSCMFLVDVNNHTMQLRASYVNKEAELKGEMLDILTNNATNAQACNILTTVLNSNPIANDILSITCIYNMTAFEKEILFAHKLYTGNNPVETKLTETVLGVKFDGSYSKTNLFANRFISIIAGSRSGKGTLTMSLLASLLASGEGVVYLDNKPDIASLFWNMERSMKARGQDVRFLALDSAGQRSEFDKAVGERVILNSDGEVENIQNVPKGMNAQLLLPLRTYKTLQLAMLLGRIRPKDPEMDKGNTFIFIDEATLLTQAVEKLYIELDSGLKGRKSDEELANYCDKVISFISEVHQAFSDISLKQGEENLTFVTIGQSLDGLAPKDWKISSSPALPKIDAPKKNLFFSILGSTQFWLSGREQVNSRCYELSPEEKVMADKTGSFIAHTGKPSSNKFGGAAGIYSYTGSQGGPPINTGNSSLFRSYFALVNNDYQKDLVESKVAEGFDSLNRLLSENRNNGFTFNFLNNVLNNNISNLQDGSFRKAMSELYSDDALIKGVGFEGLIESIVALKGVSDDSYVAGLNTGYNRFNRIFEKTNMKERFGYSCIEEYLFDCSPDSLFTNEEILNMYFGTYTPKSNSNSNIDLDIAFDDVLLDAPGDEVGNDGSSSIAGVASISIDNDDNEDSENYEDVVSNSFEEVGDNADTKSESEPFFNGVDDKVGNPASSDNLGSGIFKNEEKRKSDKSARNMETKSPNQSTVDSGALRPYINIDKPPFQNTSKGIVTHLIDLNLISNELLKNISETYGGLEAVETFRVNANGVFSINGMTYMPRFPESFYFGLPLAIQQKVHNGSLSELFNFSRVYKFLNLQSFEVENPTLGQGRCRAELAIPRNKRYSWLFRKFGNLQYINIGGVEYSMGSPDLPDDSYLEQGVGLGSKLSNFFGLGRDVRGERTPVANPIDDSLMNDIWDSRPVRILTGAFGWTMGVKAVTLAATLFGPWGLLFGALAAAGTYNDIKASSHQQQQSQRYRSNNGNSRQQRSGNSSQQKKRKNADSKDKNHNDQYLD